MLTERRADELKRMSKDELIALVADLEDALERLIHMAECNTLPGPNTLAQARAALEGKNDAE